MSEKIGFTDGQQFRDGNQYVETQKLFQRLGLTDELEIRTPTVGINVAHLARMASIQALSKKFNQESLSVTVLGISTAEGPSDFQKLLKGLGANHVSTTAIDISDGVFEAISQSDLDEVTCLQRDARNTDLLDNSQDLNLRDHLGNCCPPNIDRKIDHEAARILKPGGIAIVNITTSDLLNQSTGRSVVSFQKLINEFGLEFLQACQNNIYDLEELHQTFPNINVETLRGLILEIEPENSFVVFGEDPQGHGEWFRTNSDHQQTWKNDGFEIVEIATRQGLDSHNTPLKCLRHNVVLKKINI